MTAIDTVGVDWLCDEVGSVTDAINRVAPSAFNEEHRYLPDSVTALPGPLRYAVNPFMREIVDCFDVDSPVREVALKKGVQITYSTALESGAMYFMAHVGTSPMMYITADKELASARIENNFLPMLQQSGFGGIIRSSDEGNTRKTGKTANHLQFEGGGYLVPFGAQNANKMRSYSIAVLMRDEIDAWPLVVGKDGDPIALTAARCSAYWERRKIFDGSTPTIKGISKIEQAYLRGDQRKYLVLCKECSYPQELRWERVDKTTGVVSGFMWDMNDGQLILDSVRYVCCNCGAAHYEYDKERLFSEDHGAHWAPTARPVDPNIRSYHLPAMYSPIGMQPWHKCVTDYLSAFDPTTRKVLDIGRYQVFYNNILAEPFEHRGSRIKIDLVSNHKRPEYAYGTIPNKYAIEHSPSRILFLTCTVDVHKNNLAVAVIGWTRDACAYLVDYWRYAVDGEDDDCGEVTSPVWERLAELIEDRTYTADDGTQYNVDLTLIDAGYVNDTVLQFCGRYERGVYAILGRDRPAKNQKIAEFAPFKTAAGTTGYRILVDHYKDRLAPVLNREWQPGEGVQPRYHFNAPVDATRAQLKELTTETRVEKHDDAGGVTYAWHRPSGAKNELWDLLVYGHAAVEIMAASVCLDQLGLDEVDWDLFWSSFE